MNQILDILLTPNVAYLILIGAAVLVTLSVIAPGTGLIEILSLFALVLAGYTIFNLPINIWAVLVLILGALLFALALRKSRPPFLLVLSILALVIGSAFLFPGDSWYIPAVNPVLATIVSIISAGFFWIAATKYLELQRRRPPHDLNNLIGQTGTARSEIHSEGSVQVASELWSAFSKNPIPEGTLVRVIGMEGFLLEVEPLENDPGQV